MVSGPRDLPARQQTLKSTIAWSYELLTDDEKELFISMSVFRGGCSLQAASAVCNAEDDLVVDVPEVLGALVDKSLLKQREVNGETRFSMLETIREYAAEQLATSEVVYVLRNRHADYYLKVVEEAERQLRGPEQATSFKRLDQEYNNLRLGLQWSIDSKNVEMALRLGAALWSFWDFSGGTDEGRQWLEASLTLDDKTGRTVPALVRAKALKAAGNLAWSQRDYERARIWQGESLCLYEELGDKPGISKALSNLASIAIQQGDYEQAKKFFERSIPLHRALGDKYGLAISLQNLADIPRSQGDLKAAHQLYEEGLAIRRELGDTEGISQTLHDQGDIAVIQGNYHQAEVLLEEALRLRVDLGDKLGIAGSLSKLGEIAR